MIIIIDRLIIIQEDFQPVTYNFNLDTEADNGLFASKIKELEEDINKNFKVLSFMYNIRLRKGFCRYNIIYI